MSSSKWFYGRYQPFFWLVAAWLLLVGCQETVVETSTPTAISTALTPTPSATPTLTPSTTSTPIPPTVTDTATPTPPPTAVPSATYRPTRTATPSRTPRPRPTATVTSTPLPALFERAVIPDLDPAIPIMDTWVDPAGRYWLATAGDLYIYETPNWLPMNQTFVRIFGVDAESRIWGGNSFTAAYYPLNEAEPLWHEFGEEAQWEPGLVGPISPLDFGHGETVVTDKIGRVWLIRNGDVHLFNPQYNTWAVLQAEFSFESAIGDDDSQEQFVTDAAVDSFGNVWVSHCANQGLLFTGEGARWFDGETWSGSPELAEWCILDIEVDSIGRVWLAGWEVLLRYDPADGSWTSLDLPPWQNPLMVTDLTLDRQDNPWIGVIKGTGANWQGGSGRYHWVNGTWQSDFAEYEAIYGRELFSGPFAAISSDLAVAPNGDVWICDSGTIYRFSPSHYGLFSQVAPFDWEAVCQIEVDGYGRVWLAHIGAGLPIWYYDPE